MSNRGRRAATTTRINHPSSGAACAFQGAELSQEPLLEPKQMMKEFEEMCRAVEDKVEVKLEGVTADRSS